MRNIRVILVPLLWLATGMMVTAAVDMLRDPEPLNMLQRMFIFYARWSVGFLHRLKDF